MSADRDELRARIARAVRRRRRGRLARRVLTFALWGLLALIGMLGVRATVVTPTAAPGRATAPVAPAWPDDGAIALAEEFLRAYLREGPASEAATALARRVGPDARPEAWPSRDDGPQPRLLDVDLARVERIDEQRAAVTLLVRGPDGVRRWQVPLAREGAAPYVYDLPSLVPAPGPPEATYSWRGPVADLEPAAERLIERALRAFLEGDSEGLSLLGAPGASLSALGAPLTLDEVSDATLADPVAASPAARSLSVTATAHDGRGATYALRYRLVLESAAGRLAVRSLTTWSAP